MAVTILCGTLQLNPLPTCARAFRSCAKQCGYQLLARLLRLFLATDGNGEDLDVSSGSLDSELSPNHLRIEPVLLQQIRVCAALGDAALLENQNAVGMMDG